MWLLNPYRFGSSALWTPANTTTTLWLDAAAASTITTVGGAVSQWNDKSGNDRHASQVNAATRPLYSANAYNGMPATIWASDNLIFPAGFAQVSGQNVFAVVDLANTLADYRIFLQRTDATLSNLALYFGGKSNIAGGGSHYSPMVFWGSSARASWHTPIRRKAIIRWGFRSGSPASATVQVDGQTPVTGSFAASVLTDWQSIGTVQSQQQTNFSLSELIITPPDISNLVETFNGYLHHKWGLAANLPNDHPFKDAAPTL